MQTPSQQLSDAVIQTVTGPTWHGDALAEQLAGVTCEQAVARPVDAAHTIWELVLHLTAWTEIASARLHGERMGDPPVDIDWPRPPLSKATAESWSAAIVTLQERHRVLAAEGVGLDEQTLSGEVGSLGYSQATMIRGVVEHGAYHGGQIALLKRALSRA